MSGKINPKTEFNHEQLLLKSADRLLLLEALV
jgi:hypothetical protein